MKKVLHKPWFWIVAIVAAGLVLLGLFLNVGVHTCYLNEDSLNLTGNICSKNYTNGFTDTKLDLDTGTLWVKEMKYLGTNATFCFNVLPFSSSCAGAGHNTIFYTIYNEWKVASKSCYIQKIGFRQTTESTLIPDGQYETDNGTRYKVLYQVICENIGTNHASYYEYVDTKTLQKLAYSLPKKFNEKIIIPSDR